jgi:hypothetical protein
MIVPRVCARAGALLTVFLLFGALCSVSAQENEDEDSGEEGGGGLPIDSDYMGPLPTLYSKGDQIFHIGAGTLFPTVFTDNNGKSYIHNIFAVGGMGFLAYTHFLSPHIFIGGELSGMFIGTLNKNTLFMVPFGILGGYQFILGKFEFPLTLMLGMAAQQYLEKKHFSYLFIKPSASVYWRYNHEWSFGLNAAWWWAPQWTEDSSQNRFGNFFEITLAARFHF